MWCADLLNFRDKQVLTVVYDIHGSNNWNY